VINAVISVPTMIAASNGDIMGKVALTWKWRLLGWAATAAMAAATLAMLASAAM
jgi:Mn2+/Fe2+ NRAMP family transporter